MIRYDYLMDRLTEFMKHTGLTMLETDGPYPGYSCSSTNHSHHRDASDSIYRQLKLQSQMYRILRNHEVYINQPDDYFYQGGSKTGTMINKHSELGCSAHTELFLYHLSSSFGHVPLRRK